MLRTRGISTGNTQAMSAHYRNSRVQRKSIKFYTRLPAGSRGRFNSNLRPPSRPQDPIAPPVQRTRHRDRSFRQNWPCGQSCGRWTRTRPLRKPCVPLHVLRINRILPFVSDDRHHLTGSINRHYPTSNARAGQHRGYSETTNNRGEALADPSPVLRQRPADARITDRARLSAKLAPEHLRRPCMHIHVASTWTTSRFRLQRNMLT